MQAIQFVCIPRTPAAAHYIKLNIEYTHTEKLYDLKMVQGRSQALLHLPLVSAWFCCTVSITAVSGLYTAIIHLKICAEPRPRSY